MKNKNERSAARTTTITPASLSSTLHAFSPAPGAIVKSSFYAHLLRAPDTHTLRVYETSTGKCVSRWASDAGTDAEGSLQVGSLAWAFVPPPTVSPAADPAEADQTAGKRGKKRRKSDPEAPIGGAEDETAVKSALPSLVLALGLDDGSILLRTPLDDAPSTTLSHLSSTSPITALSVPVGADTITCGHLWSAHADGAVRVWDLSTKTLVGKVGVTEGTHWDDLAVRYLPITSEGKKRHVQLLLSHLSVHVYAVSLSSPKKDKVRDLKAAEVARCVGHVDKCFVRWTGCSSATSNPTVDEAMEDSDDEETDTTALSFLSYSLSDRFVQIWSLTLSSGIRADAFLAARLALDSGVQSVALGASALDDDEEILAAIDVEGKVVLTRLPMDVPVPKPTPLKKGKGTGIVALEVESEVVGRTGAGVGIVRVSLEEGNSLRLCRSLVKPSFEVVALADENGVWRPRIELERGPTGLLNGSADEGAPSLPTRYAEPASSTVRSGDALAAVGAASDDEEEIVNTGELDVDMAEPTLADRLKALDVAKAPRGAASGEDEFAAEDDEVADDDEETITASGPSVPATTLTTTLIQALHSSDAPLLESCLTHTSPPLIRATVKRLPSGSLVLNLLEALVERLGKGRKGVPGAASVQRARGLIEWVRQVLIVHVGFLVTVPSLVTRLSALHASLTSRLALQPTLLALNGRLELVMSQIELRQERVAARASSVPESRPAQTGRKYVEGESDESGSDDAGAEEEGEATDDEGSVEDVVLGSGSEEDLGETDEDEELDEDDFDDDEEFSGDDAAPKKARGGPSSKLALLDLEASEGSDDDFSEDEEYEEDEEDESD